MSVVVWDAPAGSGCLEYFSGLLSDAFYVLGAAHWCSLAFPVVFPAVLSVCALWFAWSFPFCAGLHLFAWFATRNCLRLEKVRGGNGNGLWTNLSLLLACLVFFSPWMTCSVCVPVQLIPQETTAYADFGGQMGWLHALFLH